MQQCLHTRMHFFLLKVAGATWCLGGTKQGDENAGVDLYGDIGLFSSN